MRTFPIRTGTLVLLTALMAVTFATARANDQTPSDALLDKWLNGPEEHLPGWNIHVQGPTLTFQLRYAVAIRAHASITKTHLAGHDLHVFISVVDGKGWTSALQHSESGKLPRTSDLLIKQDFFAKPGDYRISFLVYDPVSKRHGLWFKSVHVPPEDVPLEYENAEEVEFIDPDEPFLPGVRPAPEPLQNRSPVRIDVVVNLTERAQLELVRNERRMSGSALPDWLLDRPRQDVVSEALLSVTEMLAAWQPKGCLRVSAFDAVHSKAYLDRARDLDQSTIMADLKRNHDQGKVDQRTLVSRAKAADFFRSFLQKIVDDSSGCGTPDPPAKRVVLVVSDRMLFPDQPLQSVEPASGAAGNTQYYFLRIAIPDFGGTLYFDTTTGVRIPLASQHFDEVARLLSDLPVHRIEIGQPRDVQKMVLHLKQELGEGAIRTH